MAEPRLPEPIPFGRRWIGPGHPTVVIAEIGINHEGDEAVCARMIEEAARAGADAIKLQTVVADDNYVPGTPSYALYKRAEFSRDATARMFDHARKLGLEAFTTCSDPEFLAFVDGLAPAAHKISSGLLTAESVIRQVARTGRPVLLSTGMADWPLVERAVAAARAAAAKHVGVFQCTSIYPAPPELLNLAVIRGIGERLGVVAGFSDHSIGHEAAPIAVAAGAMMIEKHLSLDPTRPDFDHAISLDPKGLASMVAGIRRVETMLGSSVKQPVGAEIEKAKTMRRFLVLRRDVEKGQVLTPLSVGVFRAPPGAGQIESWDMDRVVGRRVKRAMTRFAALRLSDLEDPD